MLHPGMDDISLDDLERELDAMLNNDNMDTGSFRFDVPDEHDNSSFNYMNDNNLIQMDDLDMFDDFDLDSLEWGSDTLNADVFNTAELEIYNLDDIISDLTDFSNGIDGISLSEFDDFDFSDLELMLSDTEVSSLQDISSTSDTISDVEVPGLEQEKSIAKPSLAGRVGHIAFNVFFYVVLIALIFGTILFAVGSGPNKTIFGYKFFNVLSNSMAPEFQQGDLIIVKVLETSDIIPGDVVTLARSDENDYLTHRVMRFEEDYEGTGATYVVTRGDANNAEDPAVPAENIIGRVDYYIPGLGLIIKVVQQYSVPIIICVAIIIIGVVILKIGLGRRRRNRLRAAADEPEEESPERIPQQLLDEPDEDKAKPKKKKQKEKKKDEK